MEIGNTIFSEHLEESVVVIGRDNALVSSNASRFASVLVHGDEYVAVGYEKLKPSERRAA